MQKRRKAVKLLFGVVSAAILVTAGGCASSKAKETHPKEGKVVAGTNQQVKTLVYVEVNDHNPLNAGSYVLDDGSYFFDYVVLFAANIRMRDCGENPEENGGCAETDPHVHFNEHIRHILDNRDKYIKPLQDKGIKVLLGLLGDHDGISFGSMDDDQRAVFIADLKKDVEEYGLDGVNFDDEWASKEAWDTEVMENNPTAGSIWTYPVSTWGWPFELTIYRDPGKGIEPGNGTLTAPSDEDIARMWKESAENFYKTIQAAREALPNKTVSLYEYNSGRYIEANLDGVVDFGLEPWYGQYHKESANGLPRNKYAPFGVDLSGNAYASQNGAPNPPVAVEGDDKAENTIYDYANRFKAAAEEGGGYSMLYFYGLEQASNLLKRAPEDAEGTVSKESYLSMITQIIFGKKTVLTPEGGNYTKDW